LTGLEPPYLVRIVPEIPATEPLVVVAGDTVKWTKSLADFPAPTWVLTYELLHVGGDLGTITAAASGTDHAITVSAATSAAWNTTGAERLANWSSFATAAGERYRADYGSLRIAANPAVVTTLDGRSNARRILDAIQAVLEARASKDQMAYSIAGRSLSLTPLPDLVELERFYKARVAAEDRAERSRLGLGHSGRIKTRFTR